MTTLSQKQPIQKGSLSFLGFSSRIAQRLLKWTLFVGLLCSILVSYLGYKFDYQRIIEEMDDDILSIGQVVVPALAQSVWVYDQQQIEVQLKGFSELSAITTSRLVIEQGKTIQYGPDTVSDTVIQRIFPVYHDNPEQLIGNLVLVKDIREEEIRLRKRLFFSLFNNTLIIGFVAFTVAFIYQTLVTRRLLSVSEQTRSISAKDLLAFSPQTPAKLQTGYHDELDALAESIDVLKKTGGQALREIDEKESHLRAVIESISESLFTLDEAGKIVSTNPAAETMLGYAQADLYGMLLLDVVSLNQDIHPDKNGCCCFSH